MPSANSTSRPSALERFNEVPDFPAFRVDEAPAVLRRLLEEQAQALARLEADATPTWEGCVQPLAELTEPLSYAWGLVRHLMTVKDSEPLRRLVEEFEPEIVASFLRQAQSEPLYRAYKALRAGRAWGELSEPQQRIVDARLLAAEHAGIGLSGEKRERFNAIATELAQLGTQFSNNVLDSVKSFALLLEKREEVEGLPHTALSLMAQAARANSAENPALKNATAEGGPWRLSLDAPILLSFLKHAKHRELREQLYRAYVTHASSGAWDNQPVLLQILRLRKEEAALLGYESYAQLSLSAKMARKVEAVQGLLDRLRLRALPEARAEHEALKSFVRSVEKEAPELALWDIAYWAERQREQLLSFSEEELRPYFPLPQVLEGLFGLATRLFGVTVEPADGQAPVWDESVRYFRVRSADGEPIASFFLDPYTRPQEKRPGAWMNGCLDRSRLADGTRRLPVAYLVCNQSPPLGDQPSLMTFAEAQTLFHEFGHGLQHMLTQVDYVEAAGINNVEWDAVELPSQFMENWCYHRPTLLTFARHFQTGEALPESLFAAVLKARNYRAGSQFLRQVHLATLDLALHSTFDPDGSQPVSELTRQIAQDNTVVMPLAEDRFLCSFGHIFAGGYAAGYYSYKWAEVLAADAFTAFEEAGVDDEEQLHEVGARFRDTVLGLGGGKEPGAVFRLFRGRDPDPEALLRSYGLLPASGSQPSQAPA